MQEPLRAEAGAELLWAVVLLAICGFVLLLVVVAGAGIVRRYGRTPPARRGTAAADPDDWWRKPLVSHSRREQDPTRDD